MWFSVYCLDDQFPVFPVHERIHTPDEFVAVQYREDVVAELAFAWRSVDFDCVIEIEQMLGSRPIAEQIVERGES